MDTSWLDNLPTDDMFAVQERVLLWLEEFSVRQKTGLHEQLELLRQVEERCAGNTAALVSCYVGVPSLPNEREGHKWDAVYRYYRGFAQAYQALVAAFRQAAPLAPDAGLQLAVARGLYYLGRCAMWCFFRYRDVPHGDWLAMHRLYVLAEGGGFAGQVVPSWAAGQETSCMAIYLRTLMLDTLNHTAMTKKEISLADRWLEQWALLVPLERQFQPYLQLFYVDLDEDRGGRRIRNLESAPGCRYWNADAIVRIIVQARSSLQQGVQATGLYAGEDAEGVDYQLLFGYLLAEWSYDNYVRQRRKTERDEVRKVAQAIHGIFAVCQHVKNLGAILGRGEGPEVDLHEDGGGQEKWIINESPYGFGAIVNLEIDTWLGVGKLVALDYENNRDITVVGVLRSIKLVTDDKCQVGIDVLSHIPTYVLLREPSMAVYADGRLSEILSGLPSWEGARTFPGLYLPQIEDRNMPASIIMPRINRSLAHAYEMRMERRNYLVRLGAVMEQKDDWVRIEVRAVRRGPMLANAPSYSVEML